MVRIGRILMAAACFLAAGSCVHKSLVMTSGPVGDGTVQVVVECTNVRNADKMTKASFVLTGFRAEKDGGLESIPFAGSLQDGRLLGSVLTYGHCAAGKRCSHTLSVLLHATGGALKWVDVDVSAQVQDQRDEKVIRLVVDDLIDPLSGDVTPPVPGEEGAVRILVRCLNVKGTDGLDWAAFTLTNLYSRKDGEKATLPFAATAQDGMLLGDILTYGHCLKGEDCRHALTLLAAGTDGKYRRLEFDVSDQLRVQKGSPVVYVVITDEIDLGDGTVGPNPPDPQGVHIYVTCTNVPIADKVRKGIFTLSNLFAEAGGEAVTLPFSASLLDNTLTGHVFSRGRCPSALSCDHTLTLLLGLTGDGQYLGDTDVTVQMHAQRVADVIFIVVTDEINVNGDDPGIPDDPDPPVPGTGDDVHVHVLCSNVRHTEQMAKVTFALSNLYAEPGDARVTIPFTGSVGEGSLTGEVLSRGHCPDEASCSHALTILVQLTDGSQKILSLDVSGQMRAQLAQKDIYIVITEEIAPDTMVDFGGGGEGVITPLEPGDDVDVS